MEPSTEAGSGGVSTAQPSRRSVLAGAAAVAAVGSLGAGSAFAAGPPDPFPPGITPPGPVGALALSADAALHAARRLTFGPTAAVVARIRQLGVAGWLKEQLNPSAIVDGPAQTASSSYLYTQLPPPALSLVGGDTAAHAVRDLQAATVTRAIMSDRQVLEVMTEFWTNHFSIWGGHLLTPPYLPTDNKDVAQTHALGRFSDLLTASAHSPAMLVYLDNFLSDGRNPNQNYGRELLELHTVGVHGGYTEHDMKQAALVLTGWTIDTTTGNFRYDAGRHYVGHVRVMGWQSANNSAAKGEAVGQSLLTYLAHHPATAKHLATKLVRRFVSDDPPAALVSSAAAVYLANDTAISPVLTHIVNSSYFARSAGQKYRRPLEVFTAMIRALGLQPSQLDPVDSGNGLLAWPTLLGQVPFDWRPPNGFPDDAADWLSTSQTLGRWNLAVALVYDAVGGLQALKPASLYGTPVPKTAGAFVDAVARTLTFQTIAPAHRAALLRFLGKPASAAVDQAFCDTNVRNLAALVLSSPYVQMR